MSPERDEFDALPQLRWMDSLIIGVPEIDADHQQLIEDAERLRTLVRRSSPWREIMAMIEAMAERCTAHFRREEAILERDRFPSHTDHRREHARIEDQIKDIRARLRGDGAPPTPAMIEVALYFRSMLIDHLLRHDLKYKSHLLYVRGA